MLQICGGVWLVLNRADKAVRAPYNWGNTPKNAGLGNRSAARYAQSAFTSPGCHSQRPSIPPAATIV